MNQRQVVAFVVAHKPRSMKRTRAYSLGHVVYGIAQPILLMLKPRVWWWAMRRDMSDCFGLPMPRLPKYFIEA